MYAQGMFLNKPSIYIKNNGASYMRVLEEVSTAAQVGRLITGREGISQVNITNVYDDGEDSCVIQVWIC